MRFAFLAEQRQQYSITLLCKALDVSVSGYYAWCQREVSEHQREDARLSAEIQHIYPGTRGCLWQPTHSRGAQGAWHRVFTQAGRAADAAVGLSSWTQAIAQTNAA